MCFAAAVQSSELVDDHLQPSSLVVHATILELRCYRVSRSRMPALLFFCVPALYIQLGAALNTRKRLRVLLLIWGGRLYPSWRLTSVGAWWRHPLGRRPNKLTCAVDSHLRANMRAPVFCVYSCVYRHLIDFAVAVVQKARLIKPGARGARNRR